MELLDAFQAGLGCTDHPMSEGEIAEGSLTTEEEDGCMSPTKQGVPRQAVAVKFDQNFLKLWKVSFLIPRQAVGGKFGQNFLKLWKVFF